MISQIRLSPGQPKVGQGFEREVEVKNEGEVPSGHYDLETFIVGHKDKIKVFSDSGLKAGEIATFSSKGWIVNHPGHREMYAKITPSGEDTTGNSPLTKPFTVKKGRPKRKA